MDFEVEFQQVNILGMRSSKWIENPKKEDEMRKHGRVLRMVNNPAWLTFTARHGKGRVTRHGEMKPEW